MHKLRPLLLALGVVCLGGVARDAQAYPQWQFVTGATRCNQCHFAPAGGGLITGYGRDAAGDDVSTFGGSGDFLHGAVDLPGWLAISGDLRGAALSHDNGSPTGAERAVFPMQADLYARVALGEAFSVSGTIGYRAQIRDSGGPVEQRNFLPRPRSRLISREHYAMWRPRAKGAYVRAGRFFAPFGLRLAEHYAYVRRDLGFNLLYETYGANGGWVEDEWEVHVTAFAPDFLENNTRDKGVAAMYEGRIGESAALGLQTRVAVGDGFNRYTGGTFVKVWVEPIKTLLQAEGNLILNSVGGNSVPELVAFLGPAVWPVKGLMLMPFVERHQTSIEIESTSTNAFGGQLNWFPYAHIELSLLGRLQQPTGQQSVKTAFFFLHYYL